MGCLAWPESDHRTLKHSYVWAAWIASPGNTAIPDMKDYSYGMCRIPGQPRGNSPLKHREFLGTTEY